MLTLSCGHENLTGDPHGTTLVVREWEVCHSVGAMVPVAVYGSYCDACLKMWQEKYPEAILHTEEEVDDWLSQPHSEAANTPELNANCSQAEPEISKGLSLPPFT